MANLASTDSAVQSGLDPKRPTPSRLYKYKPLNDEISRGRLRSILVDNRIYFASRLDFNDPFDCRIPSFFNVEPGELRKFMSRRLKSMGLPRGNARAAARKMDLRQLREDIQDQVDNAGIFLLTEQRDNLLMWAHYASSHTGICLEFEASIHETFLGRVQPVVYSSKRPIFQPNASDADNVTAALLTKSADWAYEREWRIIDVHAGKRNCEFPPDLLTGIIFGSRTSDADRQQIRKWVSEAGLKLTLYDAVLNEREWKLDIVRLTPGNRR